jgi:hypothetical protein
MRLTKRTLSFVAAMTLAISTSAFAQEEVKAVSITTTTNIMLGAEESKGKVFHIYMPTGSILTVTVDGNDLISSAVEDSIHIEAEIDRNTAFFRMGRAGQFAVAATTKCGLSFSIVVEVYENSAKGKRIEDVLPRVVVKSPEGCVIEPDIEEKI